MIKKITSGFLTICTLLCSFTLGVRAEINYAELIARGTNTNISWYGGANGLNYAKKDGTYTFSLGGERNRLAINITDAFLYSQRSSPVKVTISCYDEGNTRFALDYDSYDAASYTNVMRESEWKSLGDTGEWRDFTFELEDASLSNHGLENSFTYDIAVKTAAGGALYVRNVKIEKDAAAGDSDPVIITSAGTALGNIYEPGSQRFIINIDNISGSVCTSALKLSVKDRDGNTVWSGEYGSMEIGAGKEIQKEILCDIDRCGFFSLLAEADTENSSGRLFTCSDRLPFSVINSVSEAERNPRLGISTHLINSGSKEELIRLSARAGFGMMRDEIRWSNVEKKAGNYDLPDGMKNVPAMVKDSGMEQMLILAYGNSLYTSEEMDAPTSATEIEGFKSYCRYIAQQYKGIVKYYEVWNEFNYTEFNKYGEGSGVYINLLKAANEAVKGVDPEAKIIGVAAGGDDDSNGLNFMQRVFNYGGLPYMDGVSFHPYQWGGVWDAGRFTDSLQKVKGFLNQHGYGDMPVYVTEMGWSTGSDEDSVSETDQAVYAVEMFTSAMASGCCEKVIWYDLQDDGLTGNREHNFGLVRHGGAGRIPYEAKPVFAALAGMNKMIGNADYVDSLRIENAVIHRFKRADGEYAAVVWSLRENERVRLRLGTGAVSIRDIYGDTKSTEWRADGIYSITADTEPIYIYGDLSLMEQADETDGIEFSAKLMRDGEEIKTVSEIHKGDSLTAAVSVRGAEQWEGLKIYTAVNGTDGLISVSAQDTDGNGELEIPIEIDGAEEIESISFLLWDNKQVPVYMKQEIR